MVLKIIDGPFDPIGLHSGNHLVWIRKCFADMVKIVNTHLNKFTIPDIIEIEKPMISFLRDLKINLTSG